jgi:hypothetical protein
MGFVDHTFIFMTTTNLFQLLMTVMDACDVFGAYFDAFNGCQSILPVWHVAWRREVKNDNKLCFFCHGNACNDMESTTLYQ